MSTNFLHSFLSLDSFSASLHQIFIVPRSLSVACRQVSFGLPCFLFPGGVHIKETLGILLLVILKNMADQVTSKIYVQCIQN